MFRKIIGYFSLWHSLLFISLAIMVYLMTVHINEALSFSSMALYSNQSSAHLSWAPSEGNVDHYLLEITDTHFLSGSGGKNGLTRVSHISSKDPFYQLKSEHNHSYKVKVKAVSPSGISSAYSNESALFICDREKPVISTSPLHSAKKVRSPSFPVTGTFKEPNLDFIKVNGRAASINPINNSFNVRADLKPGDNWLDITAQDLAGNVTKKRTQINYAPLTIISLPSEARLYWNGNYGYLGVRSGNTPQSYNRAVEGKQVIRLTHPGFNEYHGIIDFSDLSKDTYIISLSPFSTTSFTRITSVKSEGKSIDVGTYSHPFAVDYDLDGKKDLLVGTHDGKAALFINTGNNSAPAFSDYSFLKAGGEDIDVGNHAAPFIVDYNNDGASDLLVGNEEGRLSYYLNQGSNTHPVFSSPAVLEDTEGSAIAVDSYCVPCVVDWNEDNKKDLVLGSGSGTLLVYLNEGSDSTPLFSSPLSIETGGEIVDVGSFAAPFAADWDGDGTKDLLVGDGEGYIHVYLSGNSNGIPRLIKAERVKVNGHERMVEGSAVPFLVDWNQDGRKELLIGSSDGHIYLTN